MKQFERDEYKEFIVLRRWDGNILRYSFSINKTMNIVASYIPDILKIDYNEFSIVQRIVFDYSALLAVGVKEENLVDLDKFVTKELQK